MNQHLTQAIAKYEADNVNFAALFNWHLCYGIVVADMRCFAIGFASHSEEPLKVVEPHHADTLFCTYCAGDMRHALGAFLDDYDYIAFQRSFKHSDQVKLHDMHRFYQKLL